LPGNPNGSRTAYAQGLATRLLVYPFKALVSSADIYHIVDHSYGHLAYPLVHRKLVITCNDLMPLRIATGNIPGATVSKLSLVKFRGIVAGLHLARAIIAISESTKKDLIEFLGVPDHKIHVIHMGVDNQFIPVHADEQLTRLRLSLGIPVTSKVIMHVSGVSAYKNIEGVFRSLAIVIHDLGIQAHLLRVGGLLTDKYWRLARELNIDVFIHEAGHLTDIELISAYNLADVLLFPSWWEGFGLPPLEAMACGTPVVVSNRGSLPEVVGNAAVVCPPDDYLEIAKAINSIFINSEWRNSLISKGFGRSAQFKWEKTAYQTWRVYEKVWRGTGERS
jgi:glycosyltransferase involved in cell wall biosynthesis